MKALLGRKVGMSRMFSSDGEAVPVTLILCLPNKIVLRRDAERDGYAAVQLGLPRNESSGSSSQSRGASEEKKEGPSESSSTKAAGGKQKFTPEQLKRTFAAREEFDVAADDSTQELTVKQFEAGDRVEVTGFAKGKGFQGVVKRHGFSGGPASHGHRHVLRSPGSIGSAFPQHVMKGKKMAGRMGGQQVTVKNLEIMWVDAGKHMLAVRGAVPGALDSVVAIRSIKSE